jgi:hypothetical protein
MAIEDFGKKQSHDQNTCDKFQKVFLLFDKAAGKKSQYG